MLENGQNPKNGMIEQSFWGDNGPEWKTVYYYHNPEDKENYTGYTIEPVLQNISEEFYRMQKFAGLITEEEFKAKLWYKQYSENISKALDDLKQTLKDEGYDNK